jgi:predicted RNA-binding Zn-ribbon protein involved in translation (DUF1610 family)
MIVQGQDGVYIIIKCKNCGEIIRKHKNYCRQYGDEYHFNPPIVCPICGHTEQIAVKNKLTKCPICLNDISIESETCIHCGHPLQTKIKCPTCKSDNVKKISGASKIGSALTFGVFSIGKISKTFECKTCGYKW